MKDDLEDDNDPAVQYLGTSGCRRVLTDVWPLDGVYLMVGDEQVSWCRDDDGICKHLVWGICRDGKAHRRYAESEPLSVTKPFQFCR